MEKVNDAIRKYYGDYYKLDRAVKEISDLKQTGTVQKYLNNIDRLNICAKIANHHLINIILNGITPPLRQAIAHYKDLRSVPSKWKENLQHVDFITIKFLKKEQDNRSKGQGRKYGMNEGLQLREGESESEKRNGDFVRKKV